jgi:uncharacterized flavoprotein (TIGR03862 family)
MAAEVLADGGVQVDVYDSMPSLARKFLMAGRGGLNITHSEPLTRFVSRFGARNESMAEILRAFTPEALRDWVHDLGVSTFIGTSGRVFPAEMKAAPLLRAWLHRLRQSGVRFHVRHRWCGWDHSGALCFVTPAGTLSVSADATVLALGGASWSRLGSDGAWVRLLEERGVPVAPLQPANCGFDVAWSEHFCRRFAGQPLKSVAASLAQTGEWIRGEALITEHGIEGGLIYALGPRLRDRIALTGSAILLIDLAPQRSIAGLAQALAESRASSSLANRLRRINIDGVKAGLLREAGAAKSGEDVALLAAMIKALPIGLLAPRPLEEAISTAGGIGFEALDDRLMIRRLPGVFCAGEMLDWEAPTGGYLLTGCFATGRAAGAGASAWLVKLRASCSKGAGS